MAFQPLNRRTFLQGTGACIALPFLEAMLPLRASAATAGAPQRFVGMMFPNGAMISPTNNNWECSGSGAGYSLASALQPLAPYKSYVSPLHNLTNGGYEAAYKNEGGQSHWYAASTFLTGQPLSWSERFKVVKLLNPGASIDQMIGNASPTPLKSLVMGVELTNGAYNDPFFGSDHIATEISYSSQTTMPDRLDTSAKVFNFLFGRSGGTTTTGTSNSRQGNILDLVKTDIDRLMKRLGARDKAKLDEFLTSVQTLQRKVASDNPSPGGGTGGGSCAAPASSTYLSDADPATGSLGQRCKNMLDLLVIAFQCDLTRACSMMLGNENTYIPLRSLDSSLPDLRHHDVSHYHGAGKEYLANAFHQLNVWQSMQLAYLLGRLQATSDANGPLIENTLVLFGSGMSDGEHLTYNMDGQVVTNWNKIPMLLAGKGGGHRAGVSYNFNRADHANLLAAIAQAYGVGSKVGNSTGPLSGLF